MAKIKSSIPCLELCTAVTGAQLDEDQDLTDPCAWRYVNSARNNNDERTFIAHKGKPTEIISD